ncbi:MAG: PH domain-containing protein [Asgard group archaeon]|nr:PH domain-containing protein [Asgard group archaeon]
MNKEKKEIFGVGKQKILEEFLPDRKYISILIISWTLIWIGILVSIAVVPIVYIVGESAFTDTMAIIIYVTSGAMVVVYIVGIIFIFPYYNSISYALTTQEVVVNKGLLIKRTKIVPYRNITNFVMRRGIIDRIIGGNNFGTIQVETAGQGPQQSHPEQRLVGIMDVSGYTEKLRGILSKMKGQAGITADTETASSLDEEELLYKILDTLKEISSKL